MKTKTWTKSILSVFPDYVSKLYIQFAKQTIRPASTSITRGQGR